MIFFLLNTLETLQVTLDLKKAKCSEDVHQYKNTDVFQRIWNPEIKHLKVQLKVYDQNDEASMIWQHFFVDARNRIQLIYPNYTSKLERFKIIE